MDAPVVATPLPLLPPYRRPLTFGAILDETVQVYRRRWRTMVALLALASVPYVLGTILLGGTTFGTLFTDPAAWVGTEFTEGMALSVFGLSLALNLLFGVCLLLAGAAVTAETDATLRGARCSISQAAGRGLQVLLPLIGGGLLVLLATLALGVAAAVLLVVTLAGVLGTLLALIGLAVWAGNPRARRPWLKWLIILTAPFGLVIYFGVRWSLLVQAVALERVGPLKGIQRSARLVSGHWFRVAGVLLVVTIVVSILQMIPGFFASIVGFIVGVVTASDAPHADVAAFAAMQVASAAGTYVGLALFGSLSFIAQTLLYLDLRNRHEGADLAERLAWLEQETGIGPEPAS